LHFTLEFFLLFSVSVAATQWCHKLGKLLQH